MRISRPTRSVIPRSSRPIEAAKRVPKNAPSRGDWPLVFPLGLALVAYYGLTLGGHHYSIDGIIMWESAKRLLFHQTFVLEPPVRWGSAVHHVSQYGVGLTLAYVPVLALLSPFASRLRHLTTIPHDPSLPYNPALYSNLPYLLSSWINPLVTATTGCLVLVLARRMGLSRAWSVGAGLAFGIASPAAAYARFDFAQPLAGLALAATLVLLAQLDGLPSQASLMGAGACLGATLLTRPDLAVLAPWVIFWTFLRTRRLRDGVTVAMPVGLAVAIQLAINWIKFGSALETGYGPLSGRFPLSLVGPLEGVVGLLIGPSHGMLLFFPLAWLGALGLRGLAREKPATASLWIGLLVILVVFYGAFHVWWGGWSWGPRFLLPLVPMLTVASTFWAAGAPPRGRLLFLTLTSVGVGIAWNAFLVDFVVFNQWVEHSWGPLSDADAQFRPLASPLFSGWMLLSMVPPDLLWLRVWKTGSVAVRVIDAGSVVLLVACLIWSTYRLAAALREPLDLPPRRRRSRGRA